MITGQPHSPAAIGRLRTAACALAIVLGAIPGGMTPGHAAREAKGARENDKAELAAQRLFKRGQELLAAQEHERGVKMLETILDQHPGADTRFYVYLALGKHYLETHDPNKAVSYLRNLSAIKKKPDEELVGKARDLYIEGLYMLGVAHFQMKQYGKVFSTLRRLVRDYPDSTWANQAYYYIGMSHYAQEHWRQAIEALRMVGTAIDPDSPAVEFVEAGRRLYVRLADRDLAILTRLGRTITATADTESGDRESLVCAPLSSKQGAPYVSSIASEVGAAQPGDGVLQVIGGDTITVTYFDNNTQTGEKDVARRITVKPVSNGATRFTTATYESKAVGAFLGQPVYLEVRDADGDQTATADEVAVKIVSLYRPEEGEDTPLPPMTVNMDDLLETRDKEEQVIRDEVTVRLEERPDEEAAATNAPLHTGVFVGTAMLEHAKKGEPINRADQTLSCVVGDEIMATYVDELHINGDVPEERTARTIVFGEVDSSPRVAQDFVPDQVVKTRKNLVEAEAHLEIARIFQDMGLKKGAKEKAIEGLDRLQFIIHSDFPIPVTLRQNAFKLKWELHLTYDDFTGAIATCEVFNKLYPESPLVDQALMGMGKAFMVKGEYDDAVTILRRVLGLAASYSKAEAQFLIAQIAEERSKLAKDEKWSKSLYANAMREYEICAKHYPDSAFAGRSLGKVIDHRIQAENYTAAEDLLQQVFLDYEDEVFLDGMLLKWVLVSCRLGNWQRAHEKCTRLIFEYPNSVHAQQAKSILPRIEAQLERSAPS